MPMMPLAGELSARGHELHLVLGVGVGAIGLADPPLSPFPPFFGYGPGYDSVAVCSIKEWGETSGWGIDAKRPAGREDRRIRELPDSPRRRRPWPCCPTRARMESASSNLSRPHSLMRAVVMSI